LTKLTVGFIGLGSQGGPMASRIIAAGFPTWLWARRPESLAPYAGTAARIATSIAELAAACEHIGICVVDDAGVQEICAALLPAMRPGSRVVIHATVHPATCIALAEKFGRRDIALIDAPVSGGGPGAAAGTLTVMVGGRASAVAAAQPVFQTFAGLISHLGGVGAGQYAKLVNNALMAANMALADAAFSAGAALGLDAAALAELIKTSSGRSYGFEVRARLPDIALFGHGARLLAKDTGLLAAVLADEPGARILAETAGPFLARIENAQTQGSKT
jgi:3-hydroxyisobutyrate dehydrogenase-like beta-hydroxyacid dehydrogenase